MRPHAIMLKLTPMSGEETALTEPFKCAKVELDDMVFLRLTKEDEAELKFNDRSRTLVENIGMAAVQSGKTFIMVPAGTEILKIEEKWEPMPDAK